MIAALGFLNTRSEMAGLPSRFASGVIIGRYGMVCGNDFMEWNRSVMPEWTGNGAELIGAEFTPGNPGQMKFTTRPKDFSARMQAGDS
jgi:hypothetical protein